MNQASKTATGTMGRFTFVSVLTHLLAGTLSLPQQPGAKASTRTSESQVEDAGQAISSRRIRSMSFRGVFSSPMARIREASSFSSLAHRPSRHETHHLPVSGWISSWHGKKRTARVGLRAKLKIRRRWVVKRAALRAVIAVALVGIGWAYGRAQTPSPDFEIIIDAPEGKTNVECVRGCNLTWVERGIPSGATPKPTFNYGCSNNPTLRCSSGRIGGWIVRSER